MPPKRAPTSSLLSGTLIHSYFSSLGLIGRDAATATELFVNRFLYPDEDLEIRGMGSAGTSPFPSATPTSPIYRLPHEIVEMIIAHLAYDTRSLRSCSLTCSSWYIAVVPHLHYTLYTTGYSVPTFQWPNPLHHMHRLGLLPLIRSFIYSDSRGISSKQFDNRTLLHQFSALTNVRRLVLDYLDIPSFMPSIQRYFKHFSPTVRGLRLKVPKGSRRQIIYFIGLFEHLQDLEIVGDEADTQYEPKVNPKLTPLFTPPLRGQLKLSHFRRVDILNDMIDLFGGIRFHMLDLFDVDGVPLLLEACAKTLTTLHLYPSDHRGRLFSLKGTRTQ